MIFRMPNDPAIRIGVYSRMLENVEAAMEKVAATKPQLDLALTQAETRQDVATLRQLVPQKMLLRMQELSLVDQHNRLKERISCLQTGNTTQT